MTDRQGPHPPETLTPEDTPVAMGEGMQHLSAAAIEATTEIPDTGILDTVASSETADQAAGRQEIEAYFDNYISGFQGGDDVESGQRLQKYKGIFTDTAVRLFGADVLEQSETFSKKYEPFLSELGSIITSLDHNAGVYYPKEDVEDIFGTIAQTFFGDEDLKKQLGEGIARPERFVTEKIKPLSSLDGETALPLIKGDDGTWRTIGAEELQQAADFQPLEVLRQDNADKRGWNKYRFRSPTYTRRQDGLHTKPIAEGWYTSEWYKDPNYWSANIRSVIAEAAQGIGEKLAGTGTSVVFTTEGGTFKGTASPNTDLDTTCNIICESPAAFEEAYRIVSEDLAVRAGDVPFPMKERGIPSIHPLFYDRSSGGTFYRNDEGDYNSLAAAAMDDEGRMYETVRRNEKGLMVTTPEQVVLYRKPRIFDGRDSMYVTVSPESGEVRQIDSRPSGRVVQPEATDPENWVF